MAKPTTKVSSIACSQRGDTSMGRRDPLLMKPLPGLNQRPRETAARSQEAKRSLVRKLVRLSREPIRSRCEASSVGRWYESAAILDEHPSDFLFPDIGVEVAVAKTLLLGLVPDDVVDDPLIDPFR